MAIRKLWVLLKVKEGSSNGWISRIRHLTLPKDCSNVQDPLNSSKDRVLHSENFQGCMLCILCALKVPTIQCAWWACAQPCPPIWKQAKYACKLSIISSQLSTKISFWTNLRWEMDNPVHIWSTRPHLKFCSDFWWRGHWCISGSWPCLSFKKRCWTRAKGQHRRRCNMHFFILYSISTKQLKSTVVTPAWISSTREVTRAHLSSLTFNGGWQTSLKGAFPPPTGLECGAVDWPHRHTHWTVPFMCSPNARKESCLCRTRLRMTCPTKEASLTLRNTLCLPARKSLVDVM